MPVTAMIFTLNEEIHIATCLSSLKGFDDIIVVDSFSEDRTSEICKKMGVRFYQNKFEGFGSQRNWALHNTEPKYEWILILDADERVPAELAKEISGKVRGASANIAAFRLRRRFYMWGRWLKYSSLYPTWVVRLVRKGRVEYVNRGHAETQVVEGDMEALEHDLIDENLKGIDEWFERQNRYSSKEALYEIDLGGRNTGHEIRTKGSLGRRELAKKFSKTLPFRGFIYFIYSFFFRLGFLDGRRGYAYCRMRSLYYEMIELKKFDCKIKKTG